MAEFYRPGGANVPPFDTLADPRRFSILVDDFVGGSIETGEIGSLGFVVTTIVGDSVSDVDYLTTAATVLGRPGVISLNTGATTPAAGDEGGLTLTGAVSFSTATSPIYLATSVQFPSIASVEFNFGLFATGLGAGRDTDSLSIEFDASVDASFNGVAVSGSSATAVDLGNTVAASTWYTLELIATGTWAGFYVDGELLGEATTNLPVSTALVPGFKVATETSAEKSVYIDFFCMRMPVSRE